MKHLKKQTLILLSIASLLLVGLAVFAHIHKKEEKPSYSNLNSKASLNEVRSILSKHLEKGSVDNFINLVRDYNDTVGSVGLSGDFAPFSKTDYDVEKISSLWTAKHGDFIGTNCRINTYTLLKGKIKIPQVKSDSELLFQDKDAIDKGKLFDAKDQANFEILFQGSRLKPPKMSRFTPSIWRITISNSPLMTRHACCQSLSTIIWMEIPFCRSRWRLGTYDRWILICRKIDLRRALPSHKIC